MVLAISGFQLEAQETMVSHKMLGTKAAYTVVLENDTVEFQPRYSVTSYIVPIDTTVLITADTTKTDPGNLLYFQVTADGTKRYVNYGNGFQTISDSLSANKSRTWGFVFIRGKFVQTSRTGEY